MALRLSTLKNAELLKLLESNLRALNKYKKGSLSFQLSEYGVQSIREELGRRNTYIPEGK